MKSFLKFLLSITLLFILIFISTHLPAINAQSDLKEALFYTKLENKTVQCRLCPRYCVISQGKRGFCRIRENKQGVLYTLSFAKPVSLNDLDPIEKKPLFHYLPGTKTFSVATAGCNLTCKFCQNWEISQKTPEEVEYVHLEPDQLIKLVKKSGLKTLAYTYSEPTIFYEYMLETAKLAKIEGIRNVMHSNGYINEEPLRRLAPYLDAANIDLKGFSDEYYAKLCQGTLEPVLRSLKILESAGVHLEITNLVLPGYNDDPELVRKMCVWIKDNLGADTPLHFSRFFPMYKLTSLNPTPVSTIESLRKIAMECGLLYVYVGNLKDNNPAESTYCPRCRNNIIERKGYFVESVNMKDGRCNFCGRQIEGVWR